VSLCGRSRPPIHSTMTVQSTTQLLADNAARVLVGQRDVFEQMLIALLAGGHVLLEGVPGTAKTLAAKTLARLIQADFRRIQFTPDLMPSDIVGTQVFDVNTGKFYTRRGPVFTSILLADEINRAPAKTQSALLEAMAERQITIEGERTALPEPFLVIATQNPIDYEGTYPLPEAQLDRFMFKVQVNYPAFDDEIEVLRRYHAGQELHAADVMNLVPVIAPADLAALRAEVQAVRVEGPVLRYMTQVTHSTRQAADILLGGSPRASLSLLAGSKVHAAMQGRDYVTPDDVKHIALPVFRHRILLRPEAEIEGLTGETVIQRVLSKVEVPR
jgi:MoxR-like ATPase